MAAYLLTADQHRALAKLLLAKAGLPGYPSKERGAQMAINHETMARMIEARQSRTVAYHRDAPSIAVG